MIWEHENEFIEQDQIDFYQINQYADGLVDQEYLVNGSVNEFLAEGLLTGQEYGFQIFGLSEEKEGNAVALANTPNLDKLSKKSSHSSIETSGEFVGLPENDA